MINPFAPVVRSIGRGRRRVSRWRRYRRGQASRSKMHAERRKANIKSLEHLIVFDAVRRQPFTVTVPHGTLSRNLPPECRFLLECHRMDGGWWFVGWFVSLVFTLGFSYIAYTLFGLYPGILSFIGSNVVIGSISWWRFAAARIPMGVWLSRRQKNGRIQPLYIHQNIQVTPQFLHEHMGMRGFRGLVAMKMTKAKQALYFTAAIATSIAAVAMFIMGISLLRN